MNGKVDVSDWLLFKPMKIGKMELKNRIAAPPHVVSYGGPNGEVTDQLVAYYRTRARNCGLCIVEALAVELEGKVLPQQIPIYDDKHTEDIARLADAIHEGGTKAAAQIHHAGISSFFIPGIKRVWAPSKVKHPSWFPQIIDLIEECSVERISEIIEHYGDAALRVKKAGFDCVEIHGAHGYLITQFLNKNVNKRTDEYGSSLENRMRFALDVLRNVRAKVGSDFPVQFRYNGTDCIDYALDPVDELDKGGWTLSDAKVFAKKLEENGVDSHHVSAGNLNCIPHGAQPADFEEGCLVNLAKEIKKVTSKPVTTVGRIRTPELAEKILRERKADLIALGRTLIADHEWLRKAQEGRHDEIVRCIKCMACMKRSAFQGKPLMCTVNPMAGRELLLEKEGYVLGKEGFYKVKQAERIKNVLIVGGGVAGLVAAVTAAKRGHKVTIAEKTDELGGWLLLATIPPGRKSLIHLKEDIVKQLERFNVKLEMGRDVNADFIRQVDPDVVIMAVGSVPIMPKISVGKNVFVFSEVLLGKAKVGAKILIAGGGDIGTRTADYLASNYPDKKIVIVEMLGMLAPEMILHEREPLMHRINSYPNVEVLTNTKILEIVDEGVIVERDGKTQKLTADTVLVALGLRANSETVERIGQILRREVPGLASPRGFIEKYVIGDALRAATLFDAVQDAVNVALKI